ncbi:MAG: 2-oxo acid dehydrogenase subunit E2 [Treponema sp.]|jgi:pyruvate dehydrogenase E2 component (dihydrolipoamide acetyltransferase)|nr:2-oxo acid dehydrogenase subunit E2 [Treponema sp.]
MANSIIMPKTGMAMEEGVILEWRVSAGDSVSKGDVVALIETDKSTMELESDYDGVILAILGNAGETVPVTKVIAWVGSAGEPVPASDTAGAAPAAPASASAPKESSRTASGPVRATPAARSLAKELGIDLAAVNAGGKSGEVRRADVQNLADVDGPGGATPLAKRIAQSAGIPLSTLRGSGFGGKITKQDIVLPAEKSRQSDTRVPLTNIQKITGRRMSESRSTIPEVTANISADVTRMLEIRNELNNQLAESGETVKLTINDFVLGAVIKALRVNPRVNSTLDGAEIIYRGSINLGMAVATTRGLVVPVIHNAQDYSLCQLSARAAALAAKARDGKLLGDEMSGGTFTVSNVGMYGITSFTPIINPPEAAILGVCAVEEYVKLDGEKISARKKMGLSLAYDHRIVDGAESSLFLKKIKDILEAPLLILS